MLKSLFVSLEQVVTYFKIDFVWFKYWRSS